MTMGTNSPMEPTPGQELAVLLERLIEPEEHCSKDRSVVGPYTVEAPEPRD